MKNIVYLLVLFPVLVIGQSQSENYIKTTSYKQPTSTSINSPEIDVATVNVTYYDGLGRPIQQISKAQTPSGNDIIKHIEYDEFGRNEKDFLPFATSSSSLDYRTSAASDVLNFYNSINYDNTSNPYSQKEFDFSPLNRVIKQAAPGTSWSLGSGNEIKQDYKLNGVNEVKKFSVNSNYNSTTGIYENSLICVGFYSSNKLYKTITKNENWTSGNNNTTVEYIDQLGKVILKRAFNNDIGYDTYYVYDKIGNLVYVLPPSASDSIVQINSYQVPYNYTQSVSYTGGTNPLLSPPFGYSNNISGGGSMSISIQNGVIKLNFIGSWTGDAILSPSNSFPLYANNPLPDMEIGLINFYNTSPNGAYKAIIQNNSIKFIDMTPNTPPFVFNGGFQTVNVQNIIPSNLFTTQTEYTYNLNLELLDVLCYQYKYDYRNRLAEKKLPGKQWEYIVYDKLDRVVMSGPAFNPFGGTQTGWMVTKYDAFNRVVYTAWKTNQDITTDTRTVMQNNVNANTALNESVVNNDVDTVTINYSNNVFPNTDLTLLTVNYYDNYTFPDAPTIPTSVLGQPVMSNVKGLPTASWVRVLDEASQQTFEKPYTLYDNKSRAIFVNTDNYLTGSTSVSNYYNFQGQLLETSTRHARTNNSLRITTRENFEYTPQGRLLNHFHKVNSNPTELIVHNEYDELGKLISKNVGGQDASGATGLQKVDYTYNIRGWLKNINNIDDLSQGTDPRDLFAFKINYNEVENDVSHNVSALYNGNIAETFWKSNSDNIKRSYGYKYDDLNRLLDCYYQKSNVLTNSYNESMQYDKNGNIKKLNRTGVLDNEYMTVAIDNLEYKYSNNDTSNRLIQVIDHDANPNGFKDGTNQSFDYDYDANGNMISDFNKGIENITYNHLNLPTEILFANGSRINYLYDATGRKVRKIVTDASLGTEVTTDYLGGYQYLDGVLKFFPTPEGYVNATEKLGIDENETIFSYVYNYVDHLGNIRVSYTQDPITHVLKILEENHYYPFGLKHSNYNSGKKILDIEKEEADIDYGKVKVKPVVITDKSAYNLKYNGKELQNELDLNLYDYGARNYDPALGRWMNIDPLAEKSRRWTPYNYCYNNPERFIDPDGMEALSTFQINKNGEINKIDDKKYYDDQGNEVDKLIVGDAKYDKKGNLKNENINISVGVLDNKTELSGNGKTAEGKVKNFKGYQLDFGNKNEEAKNVFEFLSKNINKEFSLINSLESNNSFSKNSSIFTSFSENSEFFGNLEAANLANRGLLLDHNHSHPYHDIGEASPDDYGVKKTILNRFNIFKNENPESTTKTPTFNVYFNSTYNEY